jgi:hypothetical protein
VKFVALLILLSLAIDLWMNDQVGQNDDPTLQIGDYLVYRYSSNCSENDEAGFVIELKMTVQFVNESTYLIVGESPEKGQLYYRMFVDRESEWLFSTGHRVTKMDMVGRELLSTPMGERSIYHFHIDEGQKGYDYYVGKNGIMYRTVESDATGSVTLDLIESNISWC